MLDGYFTEKPSLDDVLHYGTKRHSGRYPWGSGENPYQRGGDFLTRYYEYKEKGMKDSEIWKAMGLTSTQFRTQRSLARNEERAYKVQQAESLREKGYSYQKIADLMGYPNDSSVRTLLDSGSKARMNQAQKTADILRDLIDEKGMIDIGEGAERQLGVSKEKLKEAAYILELEGYVVQGGRIDQVTNPGKMTTVKVIGPPDLEKGAIYKRPQDIHSVDESGFKSQDGGDTFDRKFTYPTSLDSSRLQIRYAEQGGDEMDGVIELRRGVEDISLGDSTYSQVRILVDGDRYLKGMAVYADDLPPGVDVRFNTNKKLGTEMRDVLKTVKYTKDEDGNKVIDKDNPFGSLIKDADQGGQRWYVDANGERKLSVINKRADEGDWGDWKNKLPSQFLSKQSEDLIIKQLNLTKADKKAEFDEIMSLTNPTIKRHLLEKFATDCDGAAVKLQAAALPKQEYKVILPVKSLKDNEIYAPHLNNGDVVAAVRYPHGGTFEIPILTVNNKNVDGQKILGKTPTDAVGINAKVAARLSGADFDGDTVMLVPCNSGRTSVRITSTPPLKELEGFEPKLTYGYDKKTVDSKGEEHYYRGDKEFRIMKNTQNEMGQISNLITDMTIKGAKDYEIARAVKHSMVVIDAEKHKLDYKQSEIDNNIKSLKEKYQLHTTEEGKLSTGASTVISAAKSERSIPRVKYQKIDPETGKLINVPANQTYTDKQGKVHTRMQRTTAMAITDDAGTLSAGYKKEKYYVNYANTMKALANESRKAMVNTPKLTYDPQAAKDYAPEVKSLKDKLNKAELNKPRERQAQALANARTKAKYAADPDLTNKEKKKIAQQTLTKAREEVGAKRYDIEITDKEWTAIQKGAVHDNTLKKILNHTDIDKLRERATPKDTKELSDAKKNKIAAMKASGYTLSEIADSIGVSTSTVSKYLK